MTEKMTSLQNKLKTILLSVFVLSIGLSSCSEREDYYRFEEIKGANWAVEDALVFVIDTMDVQSGINYDISVEITNNVDYPYQNLWLFSEYNKNDSTTVKDQKEFTLADEFGKWQGSGFASLFQSSHPVLKSVQFEKGKRYQISIRHGMQDKVLHGIEKVGLKISKTK